MSRLHVKRDTSPERLLRLADQHVNRYSARLARARADDPMFREHELVTLLAIWNTVRRVGGDVEKLTPAECQEVMDAIYDEENG